MNILVSGDRNWTNYQLLTSTLNQFKNQIQVLIAGGAKGADTLAKEWAVEHNIPFQEYPADWKQFGKAAGPIRNRQMLVEGQPTLLVVFHNDLTNSKGTKNMIHQASKINLPTIIIQEGA
jgi:hypothetical protein